MAIETINPTTGERVKKFAAMDADEIERRLQSAHAAFQRWSHTPLPQRSKVVARAGELLEERKEEYARLMTLEMGKLIQAGREEAAKCALGCRFYAEHGAAFLADEPVLSGEEEGYVAFHPLGVV